MTADDTGTPAAPAGPPATIREFEASLHALGFTKRQARAIAASGFKAAQSAEAAAADDEQAQLAELASHIAASTARIKGVLKK